MRNTMTNKQVRVILWFSLYAVLFFGVVDLLATGGENIIDVVWAITAP